jgi:8-oxo-dGTP diphosphatase
MQKRPEIGVGICVVKDGKVLLGKRKSSHGSGYWSFPGGHLEMYETWNKCAERETLEETNLKIRNQIFAGVTNDIFMEEKRHYVTIFIKAEYYSGELKNMEPDKCDEWRWFEWDKLPTPLFLPIKNIISDGFIPF